MAQSSEGCMVEPEEKRYEETDQSRVEGRSQAWQ